MASNRDNSAMVIEGYQVYKEDQGTNVVVKQEPIDTTFTEHNQGHGSGNNENHQVADTAQDHVREVLTQILSRKDKELSVKTVVEDLVKKNALLLAQSDASSLKPQPRKPSKLKGADSSTDSVGSILQPKDPILPCTTDDITFGNINEAIVETDVAEPNIANFDPDLVCAIGSKVRLMTQQGQTLQIDLTFYWCNFCNYKSDKKELLLTHMMDHRFHCKYCKFQSFSRAAVIYHCTQTHDDFKEVSSTLNYCTYLPDILQRTEFDSKKRKRGEENTEEENDVDEEDGEDKDSTENDTKKARYDEVESLNMEVEEVCEDGVVSTTSEDKIIIPRTAKKSLPAPVSSSVLKDQLTSPSMTSLKALSPLTSNKPPTITVSGSSLKILSLSDGKMPVISSVHSGQKAVEAAHTDESRYRQIAPKGSPPAKIIPSIVEAANTPKAVPPQKKKEPAPSASSTSIAVSTPPVPPKDVTVTSGLCWNCGYCEFTTLSQSFLKVHLNGLHQGKPHKYVALLVSSKEEMDKIKQSDYKFFPEPSRQITTTAQEVHVFMPKKTTEVERSNAATLKQDEGKKKPDDNGGIESEEEKKIPVYFKCAHCNFSGPEDEKVKVHLKSRHMGCVMYILDMKAVKLRKKRYLFFCLESKCNFKTKEADDYLEHLESCLPTSPSGNSSQEMDATMLKSLNLTKQFISRTNNQPQSKDTKPDKAAEYGCLYCSYISNNNTRLKKHVISNHQHMPTVIRNLSSGTGNVKPNVNFCHLCLWETREENELGKHLSEQHDDTSLLDKAKDAEVSKTVDKQNPALNKDLNASEKMQNISTQEDESNSVEKDSNTLSVPSTSDESRQSSVESEDKNSDSEYFEEEEKFTAIVGKSKYDKAVAEYFLSEDSGDKKGRVRPARSAAVKAQIRNKMIKPPPLYQCFHCKDHIAFGIKLMKAHIRQAHSGHALVTTDCLKLNRTQMLIYMCPAEKCLFSAAFATDVINHGKRSHNMQPTHADLLLLSSSNLVVSPSVTRVRKATPATGESYECLYCTTSVLYYSRRDMKKHMIETHPNEEFLFRDCIARKLRQQSRHYMCHDLACDFTCENHKDYNLHLLAHKKATIQECPKCSWFSADAKEVNEHNLNDHDGEKIKMVAIDLDLDSFGHLVKLVGGCVIKCEK